MVRIGGHAIPNELAKNVRTAGLGMFKLLDHHNSCAFTHDKAIAPCIERPRRPFRFIIAQAQRLHIAES